MSVQTDRASDLLAIAKSDYGNVLREADKMMEAFVAEDPANLADALSVQGNYFLDIWPTPPAGN
jgi:hypothetical protein